ncbi:hypothetical protein PSTG_10374 [Puccinia striiformis f. sp. tritici PST-78]|uniref:Uncharacterized protein n=1 Tax=Puccinia striiformis f. sp. tritici PST-78 TaxID=1165861 RepID=A0A0L0VB10_9BASI|nr:hypothetical protein PSTG_10374 [Puccinia striiformis f. sp. tritici PST-78]
MPPSAQLAVGGFCLVRKGALAVGERPRYSTVPGLRMAIGPPDPTHGPAHRNSQALQAGRAGPNCPNMGPDPRPSNKRVAHGRPMGRLQIGPSGLLAGYPRAAHRRPWAKGELQLKQVFF